MRAARLGLLLCLPLAFAACGKHQSAGERVSSSPRAQAPAAAAPAASESAAATRPAGEPTPKTLRPNQDGSETLDEGAGDNGTHNALLAAVASTIAAATPAASAQPLGPTLWQPGVNYTVIVPAQPTSVPAE